MGFLRDGTYAEPPDRHPTVTVTVTEETAQIRGFLAELTMMTLMTVFCGGFLNGVPTGHQGSAAGV